MSERINITLPDELYKRLQKYKGRFNVSGVCRAAIEYEIKNLEIIEKGQNMSAIEKLRAQKEQHDEGYFQAGKRDGIKDAEHLDYKDLIELTQDGVDFYQTYAYYDIVRDVIEDYLRDDAAFNEDEYIKGWLDGVSEFYEEIKDQI